MAGSTLSSPTPESTASGHRSTKLQPEEWDHTINIDLRGTFLTLHYCVPHLKRAGGGAIVIISSINGTRVFSNVGATAYSCAKAAQVAMAQMRLSSRPSTASA
jgi:NAD(P)-dependent dehydrogenase (short-subunit alcohol dehydrogenase family)